MLQHTRKELRLVVVKLIGKPPEVACVVRDVLGVVTIRLALGHRKFAPRSRDVAPSQVLRDATPRERELGFVPPTVERL